MTTIVADGPPRSPAPHLVIFTSSECAIEGDPDGEDVTGDCTEVGADAGVDLPPPPLEPAMLAMITMTITTPTKLSTLWRRNQFRFAFVAALSARASARRSRPDGLSGTVAGGGSTVGPVGGGGMAGADGGDATLATATHADPSHC